MDRDAFLERVRNAAHAGNAYRVHLRDFPEDTGYVGVTGEICQEMADEVIAVGGRATLVDSFEQARTVLAELIQNGQMKSALCWQHPVLGHLRLKELLAEQNVEMLGFNSLVNLPEEERRKQILSADIGISSADWAIAETGTLVVCSRNGQERVTSLVPPVHVAVIERDQILPDLVDAIRHIGSAPSDWLPSNIALITGPSKTGDIELQLTTGVHGPGEWHVIIIRGLD